MQETIAELKQIVSVPVARSIRQNQTRLIQRREPSQNILEKARTDQTYMTAVTVDQKECYICQTKLSDPTNSYTRIVEDIIPAKATVTKYIIIRRYYTHCKRQVSGNIHIALPIEMFGLQLMV